MQNATETKQEHTSIYEAGKRNREKRLIKLCERKLYD